VRFDAPAYFAGTSSPKAPSDSRSASLRSFCTMGATFCDSPALRTAQQLWLSFLLQRMMATISPEHAPQA